MPIGTMKKVVIVVEREEKEGEMIQEAAVLALIVRVREITQQKTRVYLILYFLEENCIYITNLSRAIKEYQLEDLFKKYGAIKDVIIVRDPFTKESRGFAFLTFETSESALNAISEMSGYDLNDRRIVCEIAKRNKSRSSTPGVYLGPSSVKRMRTRYRYPSPSRSRSSERRRYKKYDYPSRSRSRGGRDRSRSYSRRR